MTFHLMLWDLRHNPKQHSAYCISAPRQCRRTSILNTNLNRKSFDFMRIVNGPNQTCTEHIAHPVWVYRLLYPAIIILCYRTGAAQWWLFMLGECVFVWCGCIIISWNALWLHLLRAVLVATFKKPRRATKTKDSHCKCADHAGWDTK